MIAGGYGQTHFLVRDVQETAERERENTGIEKEKKPELGELYWRHRRVHIDPRGPS